MGATDYFNTSYESTNADIVFRELQRIVGAEDGSGMYAGNISIVPGFRVAAKTPLTVWGAEQRAKARYRDMDKWGPGEALPLLNKNIKTTTRTMRLNITDAHKASLVAGAQWFSENDAAAEIVKSKLRPGERLADIWIEESNPVWKPVVKRATGKASRSFVVSVHGRESRFNGLSEAIEASKAYVSKQHYESSLTIREEVLRDNEPRAIVESTLVKHMVTVKIITVKPTTKEATTVGGWAFYGMAPC